MRITALHFDTDNFVSGRLEADMLRTMFPSAVLSFTTHNGVLWIVHPDGVTKKIAILSRGVEVMRCEPIRPVGAQP